MFNLVQYSRVAYYDVDVLPLHSSDHIFNTKLPSENYVGAIGSPGDTYFKTGMMVLQPSADLFGVCLTPIRWSRQLVRLCPFACIRRGEGRVRRVSVPRPERLPAPRIPFRSLPLNPYPFWHSLF